MVSSLICTENQVILRRRAFFGLQLYLDEKRVTPRNPAPGLETKSLATPRPFFFPSPSSLLLRYCLFVCSQKFDIVAQNLQTKL